MFFSSEKRQYLQLINQCCRKYNTHTGVYYYYSGKTFLRKGSSPNPFPKTFNPNFSQIGRLKIIKSPANHAGRALSVKNLSWKFLEGSLRDNPFSKGFPSIIFIKTSLYISHYPWSFFQFLLFFFSSSFCLLASSLKLSTVLTNKAGSRHIPSWRTSK